MNKTHISLIVIVSLIVTVSSSSSALGYGGAPEQSSSGNYSVEIIFDKEMYIVGDAITISGNVNKYDEDRKLRIVVFDQDRKLVVNEKISVNPDKTFSYDLTSDAKLSEGEHTMRVQYGSSKVTVEQTSFMISPSDSMSLEKTDTVIPKWIKNNAGWWAEGSIDDGSFVQGIQFMIKEGLMRVPATEQGASSQGNSIPDWIKNNAGWWAEGSIDDGSFVQGIQFMIKEGLMRVSQ